MWNLQSLTITAFILVLSLLLGILVMFLRAVVKRELNQKDLLIQSLREENKDLLNRLMSQDLSTYTTMTHLNNSLKNSTSEFNEEYHSQSDAAVLSRLQGLGEVMYDDVTEEDPDLALVLADFGYDHEGPGK